MGFDPYIDLQEKLGYRFSDIDQLMDAFCHTSWANEQFPKAESNERLEFLGDSVLDLLSAEFLMAKMPTAREGKLSQARAQLVRECALAARARELGLGNLLLVGRGQQYICDVESVLADVLEAIIGAAYRDGGIQAARQVAVATKILQ